jgi:PAS domain S-box-containing protein
MKKFRPFAAVDTGPRLFLIVVLGILVLQTLDGFFDGKSGLPPSGWWFALQVLIASSAIFAAIYLAVVRPLKLRLTKLNGNQLADSQKIERLEENELWVRSMVDVASALIWLAGTDKSCSYFNATWLTYTGRSLEQEMGMGWTQGIHPDDYSNCLDTYSSAFDLRENFAIEYRLRAASGEYRWFLDHGNPRYSIDHEFLGYIGTCTDITDRKLAEDLIQQKNHNYESFFHHSDDMFFILDEQGQLIHFNQVLTERLAYASGELLEQSVLVLYPKERQLEVRQIIEKLPNGAAELFAIPFKTRSGHLLTIETRLKRGVWNKQAAIFGVSKDVSNIKLLEDNFARVFYSSPLATVITDEDNLKYIEANEAFYTLTGFDRNEVLGRQIRELDIFPDQSSGPTFFKPDEHLPAVDILTDLKTRDGSIRHVIMSYAGIHVDKQKCHIAIVRDITASRRVEAALRWNQSLLDMMAKASPLGFLVVDNRTDAILYFNQRFCEIWDIAHLAEPMRRGELKNSELKRHCINSDTLMDAVAFEELLQPLQDESNRNVLEQEIRFRKNRVVHLYSTQIRDAEDRYHGRYFIFKDITNRKQTEDKLMQLSVAVEQSPVSIVITDMEANIEYVNQKFLDITGYSRNEVIGKNQRFLQSGLTPREVYTELWHKITNGDEWHGELQNRKKNGELYCASTKIMPIVDSRHVATHYLSVNEDVTDRNRADESLRHSQKLESIGTLAGGIAHDFNNLLNAIMGQSSIALGKIPKNSSAAGNIDKVIRATERAADLTSQLLAYSGKGKLYTQDIDLNGLVRENVELFQVSVSKAVQLHYELDVSSPRIVGDLGQIQQVLMNLIINASDAMELKPGSILVRTETIQLVTDDRDYWQYTHTPLVPGAYALLRVIDSGVGMSQKTLKNIFDPFFTTKFTGRGLGLAAVLGIIKGHRGGLRIRSVEGEGTEFDIVFPLLAAPSAAKQALKRGKSDFSGEGKTLLLIDDEPVILELLEEIFTALQFKVVKILDPVQGIEFYRQHHQTIAMVILDYSMPKMNGSEVFKSLLQIDAEVKVLLCSGYAEDATAFSSGAFQLGGFLQKPYEPNAILDKVEKMLSVTSC